MAIAGRAKRFAKIGGEMVSLSAVEEMVTQVWPHQEHAVVTIPDAVKGEQLVLVTVHLEAQRNELLEYARGQGIAELSVPKKILCVKDLPLMGTGKTDYPGVQQLVNDYYQS